MNSRQQRRKQERQEDKLKKWLKTLNKEQLGFINEFALDFSKADLYEMFAAFERVIRVTLSDDNVLPGLIEHYIDTIIDEVGKEGMNMRELKAKGIDYMAKISKERDNVINVWKEEVASGKHKNDKQLMQAIHDKFLMLTKTAIKNIIAEHRRNEKMELAKEIEKLKALDKEKEEKKINEVVTDKDVKDSVEYILKDGPGVDHKEVEPKKKKKDKVIKLNKDKESTNGLLVLSKNIIMDVAGEFGTYHIENNVVTIDQCRFESKEEVAEHFEDEIYKLKRKREEALSVYKMI